MGQRRKPGAREAGFTLLEILVAMVVLSLAGVALVNLTGENTRTAQVVEARTMAAVVAENRAVEALVVKTPSVGRQTGVEPLAGRNWRWVRRTSRTDDPQLLRIDVQVFAPDSRRASSQVTVFRGPR